MSMQQVFSLADPESGEVFFVGAAHDPNAWLHARMRRPTAGFVRPRNRVRRVAAEGHKVQVRRHTTHLPRKVALRAAQRVRQALRVKTAHVEEQNAWRRAVRSVIANGRAMSLLLDK